MHEIASIRRIKSLVEGHPCRVKQLVLERLRLRDNTTVDVLFKKKKDGMASIELELRRQDAENHSANKLIFFEENIALGQIPPMAMTTDILVEALTNAERRYATRKLVERIFAVVICEFGLIKLAVEYGSVVGSEEIILSVEVGQFHASTSCPLTELTFFVETDLEFKGRQSE